MSIDYDYIQILGTSNRFERHTVLYQSNLIIKNKNGAY